MNIQTMNGLREITLDPYSIEAAMLGGPAVGVTDNLTPAQMQVASQSPAVQQSVANASQTTIMGLPINTVLLIAAAMVIVYLVAKRK